MSDHASALLAAVAGQDRTEVERLLAGGASPIGALARDSALRAAHRLGQDYEAREIFNLVRRAAKSAGAAAPLLGLAGAEGEAVDPGIDALRRALEPKRELDVVLVECEPKDAAQALAKLVASPRRETDVARRPVEDAARLVYVYRLAGSRWAVLPLVFELDSPWNVPQVTELAAPAGGIAPLARALAGATGVRVVHLRHADFTLYSPDGRIETRAYDAVPDEDDPGEPVDLAQLGVFVPAMRASTDGWHVRLELVGIDPQRVERADVVVLQELGQPAVDRTVVLAAAPSRVAHTGPPPMVRLQPDAEPGPPPSAGPRASGPPPMVQPAPAPPPVEAAQPSAPPIPSGPPPMVTQPVVPNAPPPSDEPES